MDQHQGNTSKSNFYVDSNFTLENKPSNSLTGSSSLRVSSNYNSSTNCTTTKNSINIVSNAKTNITPTTTCSNSPSPQNFNSTSPNSSSSSALSGSLNDHHFHHTSIDDAMHEYMQTREKEYNEFKNYRIFIGTWNVNGKNPSTDLSNWLAVDSDPPDIYAIGFQELDLSKEAFLFTDSPKEDEWLNSVIKSLHKDGKYHQVRLIRLIGMMLVVFAKVQVVASIKDVLAESVGTGILNRVGNKGGVAVRLDLCNTSICFVNCHLAAHAEECDRRNQDYNEINSRLLFLQAKPIPKGIKDHDQIYWFGDLNYRIENLTSERVKSCITAGEFDILYNNDQLKLQQERKKILVGFKEGHISFPPTYKYDIGTDKWDSSEKNRPPAWCDRILWKGEKIELLAYRSHPELRVSDHKPVSAIFQSTVKVINQEKYRKIYQEGIKKFDKEENEILPQVVVDQNDLNFGIVNFLEPVTRILTVCNVGYSTVNYTFKTKPNQTIGFCKEWLRVNPPSSSIEPGNTLEIEMEILVDKKYAAKLTSGHENLSDILVLHLKGGRDLFISISGTYQASCFGSSIEALVRMKCPFREVSLVDLTTLHCGKAYDVVEQFELLNLESDSEPQPCFDIPKELWILVDRLYQKGINNEELFLQSGKNSDILKIRDALDTGQVIDEDICISSVAESLLLLLDSFIDPVIPYSMYQQCLNSSHNFSQAKQVCC